MYAIFANIYHKNQPNVGKYTIHGWYRLRITILWSYFTLWNFRLGHLAYRIAGDQGVAYSIGGQELYPAQSPRQREDCIRVFWMGVRVDLRCDRRLSIYIYIYLFINKGIFTHTHTYIYLESDSPHLPSLPSLQKLHAFLRNVWVSWLSWSKPLVPTPYRHVSIPLYTTGTLWEETWKNPEIWKKMWMIVNDHLGGGFKHFYFHPEPWGRWTHFD